MSQSPPLLRWKELRGFPGEFRARVGNLIFTADSRGWSMDVKRPGKRLIEAMFEFTTSLAQSKRACQAIVNRIWRDLQRGAKS